MVVVIREVVAEEVYFTFPDRLSYSNVSVSVALQRRLLQEAIPHKTSRKSLHNVIVRLWKVSIGIVPIFLQDLSLYLFDSAIVATGARTAQSGVRYVVTNLHHTNEASCSLVF